MGISWSDYLILPVAYKRWLHERMVKEINASREGGNGQTRGAQHNTPEARSMNGMQRADTPAKLRRFS